MLEDLLPGVHPALRKDRKGNPMEQTFAVGAGELTEGEIGELIDSAGVSEEYKALPDKHKELINTSLADLWKINRIGREIGDGDLEKVANTELKYLVENGYYSITEDWLPFSVNSLVKFASEKDDKARKEYKMKAIEPASDYARTLQRIGTNYYEELPRIPDASERGRVKNYLEGEREDNMREMLNTAYRGRMGDALAIIDSSFQENK